MFNKTATTISTNNRIKKFNFFMNYFNPSAESTILDVGADNHEYSKNTNMLEKLYPHRNKITVLGLWDYKEFNQKYPEIKTITYDGNVFPFNDKQFDFVWSNAVLEHVGDFEKQIKFIKEIKRVSKRAMITTPNKYFPFETHTKYFLIHYLPKKIFDIILVLTHKEWAANDNLNLLSKNKIKKILNRAGISDYKITANKLFGFIIDYCIFFI